MAKIKQKNEYTAFADRFAEAETAYGKLRDKAATEKATAADKKAAEDAKTKLDADRKILNRLRFRYVGGPRANKAVTAINLIANLANTRQYAFTADDVSQIKEALEKAVANVVEELTNALSVTHTTVAPKAAIVFKP